MFEVRSSGTIGSRYDRLDGSMAITKMMFGVTVPHLNTWIRVSVQALSAAQNIRHMGSSTCIVLDEYMKDTPRSRLDTV